MLRTPCKADVKAGIGVRKRFVENVWVQFYLPKENNMRFAQWFTKTFGVGVPAEFEAYLTTHQGVENGYGPKL
jgi:hypothetical protein